MFNCPVKSHIRKLKELLFLNYSRLACPWNRILEVHVQPYIYYGKQLMKPRAGINS